MTTAIASFTHEHTFSLAASTDAVFDALTSPAQLERWFTEHVEVDLREGGAFRFWGRHTPGTPAGSEADQSITGIEPGVRIGFRWNLLGCPTEVTFAVEQIDGDTKVSVRHDIHGTLSQPRPRELVDDWWRLAFGNLAAHLAGGDGIVRPDFADSNPEIRLSLLIDAPPEDVFRALIEPESLNQWFAENASVDPRVGGTFNLGWSAYQVDGKDVLPAPMTILEFAQDELLTLEWPDWRGDASVPKQFVRWQLDPEGRGTRVTFTHGGFMRTVDLSDFPFGWGHFLEGFERVATGPR